MKDLPDNEMKKIISLYEKTLDIPKTTPKEQFLICPIGLVGAGKTTVVKTLSRKLSLLRISTDEIRILLTKNGFDQNQAPEIAYNLTKKYLHRGFSVIIDADCVSKKARDYIKEAKKQINMKVIWIHINPPEKFIINNLKKRKIAWLFKNSKEALEAHFDRKPLHKNLNFPFIYEFDTSRNDLNHQINEAISFIKKKVRV